MTAFVLGAYGTFGYAYDTFQGPIEGKVAVDQLQDSDAAYGSSKAVAVDQFLVKAVNWGTLAFLLLLWGPLVVRRLRGGNAVKSANLLFVGFLLTSLVACGPFKAERIEEIGPNETAFLVPLEGATKENQGKFDSIDYLEERKVAVKRISLPQRRLDTGRAWFSYEWIPTARVIKVDRSPVTREWTSAKDSGTSDTDEAIYVESKDSIGFGIGVNITTSIEEQNTAKYLYHYPSGASLAKVMDSNVRGVVTTYLSSEFGKCLLEKCREEKVKIFEGLKVHLVSYFKQFGITVRSVGYAEGMMYENKEIQKAINATFTAELKKKIALEEKLAQVDVNAKDVAIAVAKRQAAQEFAKAAKAQAEMIELEISKMRAEATLQAAKKWNGQVPAQILPQGSSLLFGLDSANAGK
ncbi:hypothetical protein ACFLZO_01170 [Patescibacteria group bacterium]